MKILLLPLTLSIAFYCANADASVFAVARKAVPVLNVAAVNQVFGGSDGKSLKTDRCGQVRELEFIALPGEVFEIKAEIRHGSLVVFQVETEDYPTGGAKKLYLDSRFVEISSVKPLPRIKKIPSVSEIITALKSSIGSPYVWGGNVQGGIPELIGMYYAGRIPVAEQSRLILAGLDCSGLLYQSTGGWTPRNTSQLISYGTGIPVAGKRLEEVAELLKPLDLIAWNGHVLIVLDRDTVIESRLDCGKKGNGGVITTPLRQRLKEIMRKRQPEDSWPMAGSKQDVFVVRRWITL